jgi:hypothetical protein
MPSLSQALMSLGLPAEAAKRLGLNGGTNNGKGPTLLSGAGTTQATATVIKKESNFVLATIAGGATGLQVPADAEIGQEYWIFNDGGTAGVIYAATPATINGAATATGVALAANAGRIVMRVTSTKWWSFTTA